MVAFFCPPPFMGASGKWEPLFSVAFDNSSTGWGGYTLRQIFPPAALSRGGGSRVMARLYASTGAACSVNKVYVAHGNYAGVLSTPSVQMFRADSSPGATIAANGSNDWFADFEVDDAQSLIVTAYLTGTSAVRARNAALTGHVCYFRSGDFATAVNSTGFTTAGAYVYLFGYGEIFV